jgi:hypothetical protein
MSVVGPAVVMACLATAVWAALRLLRWPAAREARGARGPCGARSPLSPPLAARTGGDHGGSLRDWVTRMLYVVARSRQGDDPPTHLWVTRTLPPAEPGGAPQEIRFLLPAQTALRVGLHGPASGDR